MPDVATTPWAKPSKTELQAFATFYDRHRGFTQASLARFGVPRPALEDALQEVFVTAFRRSDDLSEGASQRAWLRGISRRVAANLRRTEQRRQRKHDRVQEAMDSPRDDPQEAFAARYALRSFVSELSPSDREVFRLSEIEGYSGPEVSSATGLNLNTTYSRIRTLRRQFREQFGDHDAKRTWGLVVAAIQRGPASAPVAMGLLGSAKLSWVGGSLLLLGSVAVATVFPRSDETDPRALLDVPAAAAETSIQPTAATVPPAPVDSATTSTAVVESTVVHPVTASAPRRSATKPRRRNAIPSPSAAEESVERPKASLKQERELLEHAQAQLAAARPNSALKTLAAHARQYPQSALSDVRAVYRIEALCMAGIPAQARGEAAQFVRQSPRSPLAARARRLCGGGRDSTELVTESTGSEHLKK